MADPTTEQEAGQQTASAKPAKRLRLSVVDFNAGFGKLKNGRTIDVNTARLDVFTTSRIDDYTLVNTVFFHGQNKAHDADPPTWAGFAPVGLDKETIRTGYLQRLIEEMHHRGHQVVVGYTLDEGRAQGGKSAPTPQGTRFRDWLENATADQVKAHALQLVEFFTSRTLAIDGIDFDFEINQMGNPHGTNLAGLIVETAKALAAARPDGHVSYDNAPFLKTDGAGALPWFNIQPYALCAQAPNLIARPMINLDAAAKAGEVKTSIGVARASLVATGKVTAAQVPGHLQMMIDFAHTDHQPPPTPGNPPAMTTADICRQILAPNQVGLVLYNLGHRPEDADALTRFADMARKLDAILSPGAAAPGNMGGPVQVPLTKKLT